MEGDTGWWRTRNNSHLKQIRFIRNTFPLTLGFGFKVTKITQQFRNTSKPTPFPLTHVFFPQCTTTANDNYIRFPDQSLYSNPFFSLLAGRHLRSIIYMVTVSFNHRFFRLFFSFFIVLSFKAFGYRYLPFFVTILSATLYVHFNHAYLLA